MKGPKNGVVRATFSAPFHYDSNAKLQGKCALPISVGQAYHEGELFQVTLDLINHSFNQCDIIIGDTLQRITMKLFEPNLTEEEYYNKAVQAGEEWLKRNNIFILSKLTIPFRIIRWDTWLKNDTYIDFRKEIDEAYQHNTYFKNSINETIEEFISRFNARIQNNIKTMDLPNHDVFFNCCLEYLKEECPVLFPMWANDKYKYIVYPKPATPALVATHDLFLHKEQKNLCQWISLKFKRYSSEHSLEKILNEWGGNIFRENIHNIN